MARRRGQRNQETEAQMLSSREAKPRERGVCVLGGVCVCGFLALKPVVWSGCVCVWLFSFKTCILSTIPIG